MHAIIKTLSLHSFSSNQCSIEILGEIELCGSDGGRPMCPIGQLLRANVAIQNRFNKNSKG